MTLVIYFTCRAYLFPVCQVVPEIFWSTLAPPVVNFCAALIPVCQVHAFASYLSPLGEIL